MGGGQERELNRFKFSLDWSFLYALFSESHADRIGRRRNTHNGSNDDTNDAALSNDVLVCVKMRTTNILGSIP